MRLAAVLLLALAAPATTQDLARIDAILAEQQEREHIPGFAFVAVKDDAVLVLRTRGFADVARRQPVTPDTLFPVGSCTKSFTALALAATQDRGLVSLDESPRRLLPYFRMAAPEAEALVTLRDMLSHQTGLKAYADLAAEPGVLTREQYLRAALAAKPAAKPRTVFQYSNAMFTAAGEVLARAQGTTWDTAIERTLLAPIGMSRSVTSLHAMDAAPDHATGYEYRPAGGGWDAVAPPVSLDVLAPAGAIASSANDLARWLRFLLGGGAIEGRHVVSEAAFRDVTRPHIKARDTFSYALGWAVYTWNGHTVIEHNGGSRGISALVSFMPDRRTGFAFVANTSPNAMTRIGNRAGRTRAAHGGRAARAHDRGAGPRGGARPPPVDGGPRAQVVREPGRAGRRHDPGGGAGQACGRRGLDGGRRGHRPRARVLRRDAWRAGDHVRPGRDVRRGREREGAAGIGVRPLRDLRSLFREVKLERRGRVNGEETYVLDLVPAQGPAVALHVSSRTALVVQRVTGPETVTFADYRSVDGERVPFRWTVQDALGESTVTVRRVRFDVPAGPDAFGPRATGRKRPNGGAVSPVPGPS